MQRPIIQVAGVFDSAEAGLIAAAGATHLGLPLRLPVNVPDTTEEQARMIVANLPASLVPVLITYLEQADDIIDLCQFLACQTVQLHGPVATGELRRLRQRRPGLTVFKSLVVGEPSESRLEACLDACLPWVDAFITDTFNPRTGASGATGQTHDWEISRRLVERSPKPVILAGGLTPANLRQAIATARPAGVDVHTGVENASGRKDEQRLREFVHLARTLLDARHPLLPTVDG